MFNMCICAYSLKTELKKTHTKAIKTQLKNWNTTKKLSFSGKIAFSVTLPQGFSENRECKCTNPPKI